MARTNNLSNFLTDVAGAIKEKKGSETPIPAANFDTEILALPSQGTYEQKQIRIEANGTQTVVPSQGYDAIDELTIVTAVPIKTLQTKSYRFTQNTNIELLPDSGYDGFDKVNLEIAVPSGSINNQDKTITENGVYTADQGYTGIGTATVNVPQPQNLNVTAPASITVDMFDDSTTQNVLLFTLPPNINITVMSIFYGKWKETDEWTASGGIGGNVQVTEGTLTQGVNASVHYYDSPYGKIQIALIAEGYNTQIIDITVNKQVHNYGIARMTIEDQAYKDIVNDLTWTVVDTDTQETVTPTYIHYLSNYWSPTFDIALPEGAYEITMNYGQDISATTEVWVKNDTINDGYLYPPSLPGFVFNAYGINISSNGNSVASATVDTQIDIYDENNTLLETVNLPRNYYGNVEYRYTHAFDHYTVTITCWETGTSWSDTYTESMEDVSIPYFIATNAFVSIIPYLDGSVYIGDTSTFASTFGLLVQKVNEQSLEVVGPADYIIISESDGSMRIEAKWPSASNLSCRFSITDSDYDPADLTFQDVFGGGAPCNIYTKRPTVTVSVHLQDIDGNPLPFIDTEEFDDFTFTGKFGEYSLIEGTNHSTTLIVRTRANMGNLSLIYPGSLGGLCFLLISAADIAEYDTDTSIERTIRLPISINSNKIVAMLGLSTFEGIPLSAAIDQVYPVVRKLSDPSVTYTWTQLQPLDNSTSYYWAIKVDRGESIEFVENLYSINNIDYKALQLIAEFGTSTPKAYDCNTRSYQSLLPNNTAAIRTITTYAYNGGPQLSTEQYDLYKIDIYRNNILIGTQSINMVYYQCPFSFELNDEVEFRVYRNDGDIDNPQWSTRYKSYDYEITEVNTFYDGQNIYLEEVDAYIDDVPYRNTHIHTVEIPWKRNIPIATVGGKLDVLLPNQAIIAYNAQNEDITDTMSAIQGGFSKVNGETTDPNNDYYLSYALLSDEFYYYGPQTLSVEYTGDDSSIYLTAIDAHHNEIATSYDGVIVPNVPFYVPNKTNGTYEFSVVNTILDTDNQTAIAHIHVVNVSGDNTPQEDITLTVIDNNGDTVTTLTGHLQGFGPGGYGEYDFVSPTLSGVQDLDNFYNYTFPSNNAGGVEDGYGNIE